MGYVFWGMAFVLLDITVDIGHMSVGLLPDWLGYWWMAKGFLALEEEWDGFRNGRIPVLALAAFSGVLYSMDLLALSSRQAFLLWVLALAGAAAAVTVTWLVCRGIHRMEEARCSGIQGGKLRELWTYLAVLQILAAVLDWVPLVGTVCAVAAAVMALCWLAALWDTKKRFENL